MRILIYLLAMLTGFSATEAARHRVTPSASVDASIGQPYAAAAIAVTTQVRVSPIAPALVSALPFADVPVRNVSSAIVSTTPVLLHDVILG